jgi:hypothetical protein
MAKKGGNPQNLVPDTERTPERIKEIRSMAGKKSGEVRKERKLLSIMYAEMLAKGFEVEGEKLSLDQVVASVLMRSDAASVSMLKEIREATEGSKVTVDGEIGTPVKFVFVEPQKRDADTE